MVSIFVVAVAMPRIVALSAQNSGQKKFCKTGPILRNKMFKADPILYFSRKPEIVFSNDG
jgi:hypothetical protein